MKIMIEIDMDKADDDMLYLADIFYRIVGATAFRGNAIALRLLVLTMATADPRDPTIEDVLRPWIDAWGEVPWLKWVAQDHFELPSDSIEDEEIRA